VRCCVVCVCSVVFVWVVVWCVCGFGGVSLWGFVCVMCVCVVWCVLCVWFVCVEGFVRVCV